MKKLSLHVPRYPRFSTLSDVRDSGAKHGTVEARPTLSALSVNTVSTIERLPSQWEDLMRKYSMDCRQKEPECIRSSSLDDLSCELRPMKTFHTGSQYEGTWDALGMCGYGTYTFPNGVIYEGEFENNMFHGDGELRYPNGIVLKAKWINGEPSDKKITFPGGVHYEAENWTYCKEPDRRFTIEYQDGIQPSGRSYKTAEQPSREIPPGMYDSGTGFYDPKLETIFKYNDITTIERCPGPYEQQWIVQNCRTNPGGPLGHVAGLYESWQDATLEPQKTPTPKCLSAKSSIDVGHLSESENDGPSNWSRISENALPSRTFKYEPKMNVDAFRPDHREDTHWFNL